MPGKGKKIKVTLYLDIVFECEERKTESIEELIQRVQRLKTDLQWGGAYFPFDLNLGMTFTLIFSL